MELDYTNIEKGLMQNLYHTFMFWAMQIGLQWF